MYCRQVRDDKVDLMKVKTTGQATPIVLKGTSGRERAVVVSGRELDRDWRQPGVTGWADHEAAGRASWTALHVLRRRKYVYSVRSDKGREDLFRIDIATGAETVIGNVGHEFRPGSNL